jgi:hypothetical protein
LPIQACDQTRQLLATFRERTKEANAEAVKAFGPELVLFDMAVVTLTYWMLLGRHRDETNERILWQYDLHPQRPAAILESLFAAIISDVLAFRMLLLQGLGQPLRAVFRNILELSVIALAITVDEPFFNDYMSWTDAPEQENLKAWNKVRPKVAFDAVSRSLERSGFDQAARLEFHLWRKGTYAWMSGFEHGHPVALLVSSNGWIIDHGIKAIVGSATWGLYEFVSLLTGALFRVHGWRGHGSELSAEIILSTRMFLSYAREVMAEQDKSEPTEPEQP